MILGGRDVADYIKQRHYEQARGLKPVPKLVIIYNGEDPATLRYMRAKQNYGSDIGIEVVMHRTQDLAKDIQKFNSDASVTGIIVQLPLQDANDEAALEFIDPSKDIDDLGSKSEFDPATPKGIMWLLGSYAVDIKHKTAVVVGQGKLVGKPIAKMLASSGAEVITCDEHTQDLQGQSLQADILVVATGQAKLIQPDMVKDGAVIVDCGSPDPEVDPSVQDNPTIKITPVPGGVGPMTVVALIDNLLIAATKSANIQEKNLS